MFNKNIIYSTIVSVSMLIQGFSLLYANGDDDHSKDSTDKAETNQLPYAEGYTGNFEIVVTLADIKPNVPSTQKIYLSDYKTNDPVENAKIQIEITGVDNSKITTPIQIEPGIYEFSVEFSEIKKYDFLFNITSGGTNDLIPLNEVDFTQNEPKDNADTDKDKSFLVKVFENLFWIISTIMLILLTALIFYRIGKRNNSKINLPQPNKSTTKYEI